VSALRKQDIKLDIEGVVLVPWTDLKIGMKSGILEVSMEEIKETYIKPGPGVMQEILSLAQALALAVDRNFMKREHAGAIWKRMLTFTGVDTTKKEVIKDGTT